MKHLSSRYSYLDLTPFFGTTKGGVYTKHLAAYSDEFERYSFQLFNAGRQRYGTKAIAERIRWHLNIETKGEEFKMSNNYTSCYARLLVMNHPELKGFFLLKTSREKRNPPQSF